VPGVRRHQAGDRERRVMFVPSPETLAAVDAVVRLRRRPRRSPEQLAKLRAALVRARAARQAPASVQSPVFRG
jgi:hypothetical protein